MNNQERVYKILEEYLQGSLPHGIDRKVMSWLTDGVNPEEKEQALSRLWDEKVSGERTPDKNTIEAFYKVCLMLGLDIPAEDRVRRERKLREMPARRKNKARFILKIAAVVIPVMALAGSLLVLLDRDSAVREQVAVSASPAGQKRVELPDGSVVYLNSSSELAYAADFGKGMRREVSLSGEAFFEVDRSAGKPFIVRTGDIDVRVLGTEFNVTAREGDNPVVELASGSVAVKAGRGKCLLDAERNKAVYDPGTKRYTLSKVDVADIASWRIERLSFSDTPIEEVFRQIGRWYDINIELPEAGLARSQRVTTSFGRDDGLEYVLSIIYGITDGFSYRIDKDNNSLIVTD